MPANLPHNMHNTTQSDVAAISGLCHHTQQYGGPGKDWQRRGEPCIVENGLLHTQRGLQAHTVSILAKGLSECKSTGQLY